MRGFEDTYVDIVDYIVRITDRIWEDQDVGYIYDTYAPAAASTTTAGRSTASSAWSRARCSPSTPSPTRRHYADDVIWAGNEDEGFATSHRAINIGHHLGPWRWGPADRHARSTSG